MTTITADRPARPALAAGPRRGAWLAPTGGLLFVAGMIALLLTPGGADTGETPAEVVAHARAQEDWLLAGGLFALAAFALLGAFAAGLTARIRALGCELEAQFVAVGGTAFALLLPLALAVWTAPLVDLPADAARAEAQAETYLAIDDLGWWMFALAGIAAALMAVAASSAALRSRAVPAWLGWLGLVVGAAAVATVAFFGLFAWLAWIAGASVVLLARRS